MTEQDAGTGDRAAICKVAPDLDTESIDDGVDKLERNPTVGTVLGLVDYLAANG